MIPIDRQVQQTMGAFRGQPDKLMQRYSQNKDLIDLFVLQEMKSEQETKKRQMMLDLEKQPGTIKEQREQEVLAGYKEKAGRQVSDVAKNTAGVLAQKQASANANMQRQGIMQQPTQTANNGGLMQMAGGGIVGFAGEDGSAVVGGITQEEIDAYRNRLNPRSRSKLTDAEIARRITAKRGPGFFAPGGSFSEARKEFQAKERRRIEGGEVSSPEVEEPKLEYSPSPSVTPNLSVSEVEEDPTTIVPSVENKIVPPVKSNTGNENKATAGLDSLNVTAPTIEAYDSANVENMTKPILEKYGLDNLGTVDEVRSGRTAEIDTALNREGRLAQKQSQLVRQEGLNQERLDPKKLKLDAILRGLMGAGGGGNFAAVGTAGMNELDKQELAKQDALNKSLGIENELMGIDLEIGKFGITQAGEAEKLLAAKQEAAATMVSTFTTQELQTHLAEAKMELEANLGNVRTEMERLQIESLDKFRKASTREDKRKILSEMRLELLNVKDAARAADTKYTDLQDAAEKEGWFGGRDDEAIREFEEYARAFEFKWLQKESTLGITNLEEEISLGDSGGSGSQDGFSIKRQ